MSARAAKAYANNDAHGGVLDQNPVEIIVLIFERLFDHLKLGKIALEKKDYGIDHFTKANDLIQKGLLACLDYEQGGEIANNHAAIYEWSLREIIRARIDNDPTVIENVINILGTVCEGWLSLTQKEPVGYSKKYQAGLSANVA
ncbi:flagellar export chaperone FliS [Polynucleobacter sp. MWH-UH2A]|uniref:flagellar export chaperone FliS n=1 Tax=Polynucleobacter sp. MWH-UH2A TaxID=1855617 RepID=UPI001BFD293D|nr:flagellar export chaperone FliS [Polynucleobacter sp. MWH-UH2A]QWD64620.1 flagellar export chaperone FliS [Polynucleobacter sp. MWH-UH2A]